MAKLIKFPLEMANGTKVRTLEDLKEHYDIASVIKYYKDGRLLRWLKANYQDEIAENLQESEKQSLRNIFSVLELPEPSDEDLKNVDLRNISDTENSAATEEEKLKARIKELETEVEKLTEEILSVKSKKTPEIGDIAYSDGSVSAEYDNTKTPVGIVIEVTNGRVTKIVSLDEIKANWQYAKEYCSGYKNSYGCHNWHLPSKKELNQLYKVKNAVNTAINKIKARGSNAESLGGIDYWSSSELYNNAWYQSFSDGYQSYRGKSFTLSVRAVRAF